MARFSSLLLVVAVLPFVFTEDSGEVEARSVTDSKCPHRSKIIAALTGHKCQKSCKHQGCSKNRMCVCDGKCGLSCIPQGLSCPWPVMIDNAETQLAQESNMFGNFMGVMCMPGFRMADGQEVAMSRCQGDRKWSFTAPCEGVLNTSSLCKPPPGIENGFHDDGPYNTGREVRYWCDYGYRLEGANSLLCQENEEWSHAAPTCHSVMCSQPPQIAQGKLVAVHRPAYPVKTFVYYLCKRHFYLDGPHNIKCLENGSWSEPPYCRARCPIPAKRSRMIYQGRKLWVNEIPDQLVHHGETVTFFCRGQNKTCHFKADSQCFDGVLKMPDCYDEPTRVQYHMFPQRIVSEIPAC